MRGKESLANVRIGRAKLFLRGGLGHLVGIPSSSTKGRRTFPDSASLAQGGTDARNLYRYAEMDKAEKNKISHRGKALEMLAEALSKGTI